MNPFRWLSDLVRRGPAERELSVEVQSLLASYNGPEPERVRRAIVSLADGETRRIREWLTTAHLDYRDVLLSDELARTGRPLPVVDVARLAERLRASVPVAPVSAASSWASLELIDVGASVPEVLKLVRAATSLGLADVAALVESAPVTILAGVPEERAAEVAARLRAVGATVAVH